MRVAFAIAAVLAACASERPPPPAAPGEVSLPAWASATGAPPMSPPIVSSPPISLGTAEDKPKYSSRKKIDLDVVGADLPNVCRLIGELAGVNVVVADDVTGTVTIKMKSVPWDEALDAILLSKGYRAERHGNVVVVRR